jgi:hypothetical protein
MRTGSRQGTALTLIRGGFVSTRLIALTLLTCPAFFGVCVGLGQAQDTNPASSTSEPKSGVSPKAPAEPSQLFVLPADCLAINNNTLQQFVNQQPEFENFATGQVQLTVNRDMKKGFLIRCGLPRNPQYIVQSVNGGDMTGTRVRVWSADDSKAQVDFLREEVKVAIDESLKETIVKNAAVQDAVAKAMIDQKALQSAVNEAVEDAVAKAIQKKLPEIIETTTKQVLNQMKTSQGASTSTTPQ